MTLTQRHKIFAALLVWSSLFSISQLIAATCRSFAPATMRSAAFSRRFGSRKKINCSTNTVSLSI